MSRRDNYNAIKKATVAVVMQLPDRLPQRPFTIIGSGFCVHPAGIVVTCAHVFQAFFDPVAYKKLMETIHEGRPVQPLDAKQMTPPSVLFFGGTQGTEVMMNQVGVTDAVTKTDFDLAVFKLNSAHTAFRDGFPTIPIADCGELHEMMEIATCGFPLGDSLHDQLGTVTSSFTQGRISSIIPVAGAAIEHLKGFQLDLTATNGNSGGPVFSLDTGHVFGVLQGGVIHPSSNTIVQGITKAEPVYPALANDLIERLLNGAHRPAGL